MGLGEAGQVVSLTRFLFVGEKPSLKAEEKGIVWADGGLAAKQLFDGLRANQIDPAKCVFYNLFGDYADDPEGDKYVVSRNICAIRSLARANRLEVVAMGKKVSQRLARHNVEHRMIVHPAARGTIRGKEKYAAHIAEKLTA